MASMPSPTAPEIISALGLKPHPEGGHYRETFRDPRQVEGRPASTAVLFLLASGERSHWHRVDAVEVWHYYAGAPLKLEVVDGPKEEIFRLGADIHAGEVPHVTVPARALASSRKPRSLDIDRLHCRTRFLIRRIRNGAWGLVAAQPNAAINSRSRYLRPLLRMHAT